MDNKKAYIKVDVEKELPANSGDCVVINDNRLMTDWYSEYLKEFLDPTTTHWFKEIDLTELMMDFSKMIDTNFDKSINERTYRSILDNLLTSKGIQL